MTTMLGSKLKTLRAARRKKINKRANELVTSVRNALASKGAGKIVRPIKIISKL